MIPLPPGSSRPRERDHHLPRYLKLGQMLACSIARSPPTSMQVTTDLPRLALGLTPLE